MPAQSGPRGVNTTQMSARDPRSQTKLAATCTNTPLCPIFVCASLMTCTLRSDIGVHCQSSKGRTNLIHSLTISPCPVELYNRQRNIQKRSDVLTDLRSNRPLQQKMHSNTKPHKMGIHCFVSLLPCQNKKYFIQKNLHLLVTLFGIPCQY